MSEESSIESKSIDGIFMELSNNTRCSMLLNLMSEPMRLSTLAYKIGISIQDAHRNISRLIRAGMVVKSNDGKFILTEYGRLISYELSYFIFLNEFKPFMHRYTLSHIPNRFMHRLNVLSECRIIYGVSSVLEKLKSLERNAREYFNIIVAQAWYEEGLILLDLIEQGVDVRMVLSSYTLLPKEIHESDISKSLIDNSKHGRMRCRFIDHVGTALYISESQAAMVPITHSMEFDMNLLLISDDEGFYSLCSDIFEYYWDNSTTVDSNRLRVVG
jgi:predicted transcriptional regulator